MRLISTFCLFLFSAAVQSINPRLATAASTPPSALSASSSPSSDLSPTITTTPHPILTPPPSSKDIASALQKKWHLTQYYTCITIGEQSHCGWHEDVLPGGDEIAQAPRLADRKMAGMAGGALIVAGLIL